MKKFLFILIASMVLWGCDNEPYVPEGGSEDNNKTEEPTTNEDPENKGDDNNNGDTPTERPVIKDIVFTPIQEEIVSSYNTFAWNMFKQIDADPQTPENYIFSPLSASIALSMIANGAAGETQDEIIRTLGLTDFPMEEINGCTKILTEQLSEVDSRIVFNSIGSLWYDSKYAIKDSYIDCMTNYYNSDILKINRPTFVDDANAWCSEKTNGMIKNLFGDEIKDAAMLLMNALYFNGGWTNPFDKELTAKSDFHNSDGSTSRVDMMYSKTEGGTAYLRESGLQAITLPFGSLLFNIAIILPDADSNIDNSIAVLHDGMWTSIINNDLGCLLELKLPKFDVSNKFSLNTTLKNLGITKVFSNTADFSAISNMPLSIDQIIQGTHIKIDEEGAEAAAVTGVNWETGTEDVKPTYTQFYVDRPFIFVLYEGSSNAILFAGKVGKL